VLAAIVSCVAGCAGPAGEVSSGVQPPVASIAPSPTGSVDPMDQAPAIPTPKPGATVDAAAQAKADAWLAGAVLPPGAVKVQSPPSGTSIGSVHQGWWCQPMATAGAYWTVSGMGMVDAANWLRQHPSNGLQVVYPALETPNPDLTNDSVFDFASPTATEGMTFQLATHGDSGAVIHLEIGVLAQDSVCATAGPGSQLMTAGG
jgi:hypothetical protein